MLDRDGTIIVERHYLSDPDQVELVPNAARGLRTLADLGLGLVIVTNQSGIARGYFDRCRLDEIHRRLGELLATESVPEIPVYVCPHLPQDQCCCRKPMPGLLHRAAIELDFDPLDSFVIGDKPCDVNLGKRVLATTLLVRTGYGAAVAQTGNVSPDYVVEDLAQAAGVIGFLLQQKGRVTQRTPIAHPLREALEGPDKTGTGTLAQSLFKAFLDPGREPVPILLGPVG